MKKISRKILGNKGIAIESVIFTMMVILMLCTLLLFISMRFATMAKFNKDNINERLYLDQIADDYLNYIDGKNVFDDSKYVYLEDGVEKNFKFNILNVSDVIYFKVYKELEELQKNGDVVINNETVLYVSIKQSSDNYDILKWSYGE